MRAFAEEELEVLREVYSTMFRMVQFSEIMWKELVNESGSLSHIHDVNLIYN